MPFAAALDPLERVRQTDRPLLRRTSPAPWLFPRCRSEGTHSRTSQGSGQMDQRIMETETETETLGKLPWTDRILLRSITSSTPQEDGGTFLCPQTPAVRDCLRKSSTEVGKPRSDMFPPDTSSSFSIVTKVLLLTNPRRARSPSIPPQHNNVSVRGRDTEAFPPRKFRFWEPLLSTQSPLLSTFGRRCLLPSSAIPIIWASSS